MARGVKNVAVIIPAYRVSGRIVPTVLGIPEWVNQIFVVNDASPDETAQELASIRDPRLTVLLHPENRGVGAALVTGYEAAIAAGAEILVVMAGDNQMCPGDLPALIAPILNHDADYVKGNRLMHPEADKMPFVRRAGTQVLAAWTRWLGGLEIGDSQCGYTALSRQAACAIPLTELYPRYGYPGHLLLTLADAKMRIREVPVRPIYAGERSGLRPWHMLTIAFLVLRRAMELRRRRFAGQARSVAVEG